MVDVCRVYRARGFNSSAGSRVYCRNGRLYEASEILAFGRTASVPHMADITVYVVLSCCIFSFLVRKFGQL